MSIEQMLYTQVGFKEGLEVLHNNKPLNLILCKAAEELNELAAELLKSANKGTVIGDEIAEELVDVTMHLCLIQRYVKTKVIIQVPIKVRKFLDSKDYKKYKNGNTQ